MSIKGWTVDNYNAAVERHAKLTKWLLANYATSDWRPIRDAKCEAEELGQDIKRFEARMERAGAKK